MFESLEHCGDSVVQDVQLNIPLRIGDSVRIIKNFALQKFDQEVQNKRLIYHTRSHLANVERRSRQIFQAVRPSLTAVSEEEIERLALLLNLCAIAHDMVQIFKPQQEAHETRKRESGVSEHETIAQLLNYIAQLNAQIEAVTPGSAARLSVAEMETIRSAIAATICTFDPTDQAIYQPELYQPGQVLPLVARILALADIGALGMDGIAMYQEEGSLLFLEENLDVIPLLRDRSIEQLEKTDRLLAENIRQRLLKRCQFQVSFAKSRFARSEYEMAGFPVQAIPVLRREVFKYLTKETIEQVETITPTKEETTLGELLEFFQFDRYLKCD